MSENVFKLYENILIWFKTTVKMVCQKCRAQKLPVANSNDEHEGK